MTKGEELDETYREEIPTSSSRQVRTNDSGTQCDPPKMAGHCNGQGFRTWKNLHAHPVTIFCDGHAQDKAGQTHSNSAKS
jgi:hypothetical protein